MSKIEETLWNNYDQVSDLAKLLSDTDMDRKKELLDERDKIRNELIKLELGTNENEIKRDQIKAEDEREKIRNRITIITFSISTALSLYAIAKTFKFDQDSTITSTLGHSILNGIIPKMFKR